MRKGLLLAALAIFCSPGFVAAQAELGGPETVILTAGSAGQTLPSSGVFNNSNGGYTCCPLPRTWASAEFLLWWTKNAPVDVPLATAATDPAAIGFPGGAGSLGDPNTAILLGGQSYNLGTRYGGRFTFGRWLDDEGRLGIEANYLFLSPKATTTQVGTPGTPGSPNIGVPINLVAPGLNGNFFGTFAGPFLGRSGTMALYLSNALQGVEVNGLIGLRNDSTVTINGLIGFRYLYFRETMDFNLRSDSIIPLLPFSATTSDHFQAVNNFYGGQLGLRGEYQQGSFFINGTAKVALGSVNQAVDVAGNTAFTAPGVNIAAPNGIFAQGTNSGHFDRSRFAVLPEITVNVGYNITQNLQAFVGYNFLYISDVARPGQQVDRNINPTQGAAFGGAALVGPAVPQFPFNHTDFWAQGINFGVSMKW